MAGSAIHAPRLGGIAGDGGPAERPREEGGRDGYFYECLCFHFHNGVIITAFFFQIGPLMEII
jgi:hypothetical protein